MNEYFKNQRVELSVITLKEYQRQAVAEALQQFRRLLGKPGSKVSVFQAPTGSGKTIMLAELLKLLTEEHLPKKYVFIWFSLRNLHLQSKEILTKYLRDTRYNLITLDGLSQEALPENTVLFANWHSVTTTKKHPDSDEYEWSNVYVKIREDGRNIIEVLDKTRQHGYEIILIVDESHRNYLTNNSQQFINQVIKPKLTLEVSATPQTQIRSKQIADGDAGFITVAFDDVVQSGLIKQEATINEAIGKYAVSENSSNEIIINAALNKYRELKQLYKQAKIPVNPLILIQLPTAQSGTSDSDMRAIVETILDQNDITYDNGKLAIYLSEDKKGLSLIKDNQSDVEVLIFKEAIAVGWDCPRAQILVMFRAIGSLTFEIQTIGRILRMPEAKHYSNAQLNKAFIYTNMQKIRINNTPEDFDFFKMKPAHLKEDIVPVKLPSTYLHRQDYGDLTAVFSKILVQELNKRFDIRDSDIFSAAYEKVSKYLELSAENLTVPLLSDILIRNPDDIEQAVGSLDALAKIQIKDSDVNIQHYFNHLMKIWCLPYAPSRSFSKLKIAFYNWFHYIGYDKNRCHEIQRIIICSPHNQQIFNEVINTAKRVYEQHRLTGISERNSTKSMFTLPQVDWFGENYEQVTTSMYAYKQCYLRKHRSKPEKDFEKMLDKSSNIAWWYKNGETKQQYFAITYNLRDQQTNILKLKNFYPDYIVQFADGRVGIYDTKSGRTLNNSETASKSDALQAFIKQHSNNALTLTGGILSHGKEGFYIFQGKRYTPVLNDWRSFLV